MTLEKAEADVTTRNNSGWRANRGTLKDFTLEFMMVHDTADTDWQAFRDSFLNNTSIEVLVLDGAVGTSGSQGIRATVEVFNFTRGEELENAMMTTVSCKPTYATNPPAWYTA